MTNLKHSQPRTVWKMEERGERRNRLALRLGGDQHARGDPDRGQEVSFPD